MPKPRADKTSIIREALDANPGMGNADLVELLNDATDRLDDKLVFTVADLTGVKRAIKKQSAPPPVAPEPVPETPEPQRDAPARKQPRPRPPALAPRNGGAHPNPVDLIDKVFDLAGECGGFEQLKRLVDRIAELRGR